MAAKIIVEGVSVKTFYNAVCSSPEVFKKFYQYLNGLSYTTLISKDDAYNKLSKKDILDIINDLLYGDTSKEFNIIRCGNKPEYIKIKDNDPIWIWVGDLSNKINGGYDNYLSTGKVSSELKYRVNKGELTDVSACYEDIENLINNVQILTEERKKKKMPTLPNHITPVISDKVAGIDILNNNMQSSISSDGAVAMSEAISRLTPADISILKQDIVSTTLEYLISEGMEEDDAAAHTFFEIVDEIDRLKIEVTADLNFDEQGELSQLLNSIIQEYDSSAHFSVDRPGALTAYIYFNKSIEETLRRIDEQYLKEKDVYSNLLSLYEATQQKLSSKDKDRLADFVTKTDDVDEIKTFITGLTNQKNESVSLNEYMENDNEVEEEFLQYGAECSGNIYDDMPKWVQIYLDEFDAPWVRYGKLPSGVYFYSDLDDLVFFSDEADFIADQEYGFNELRKAYAKDPEAYDFSMEFTNMLETGVLKEDYPDDIHRFDNDPRSPLYSGEEQQWVEFTTPVQIKFSQRGPIENGYWDYLTESFENDFDNLEFDETIEVDNDPVAQLSINDVQENVAEVFGSSTFQQLLPLEETGVFKISGTMIIPVEIWDVIENSSEEYWLDKYDTSYSTTKFRTNNFSITQLSVERISY